MAFILAAKVVELTVSKGWDQARLAREAPIDTDTVGRIFGTAKKGRKVYRCNGETAQRIARAFQIEVILLLCDNQGRPLQGAREGDAVGSWWIRSALGQEWSTAQNGLRWTDHELEHRHDHERARGKRYDLSQPPAKEQRAVEACLKRHRHVCKLVGKHPNVVFNLDIFPDPRESTQWWVVDEWVSGATLGDLLERGPLPPSSLSQVMIDVANGLDALHAAGIIRRDLTPRSILVSDNRALLTDFELAKLPGTLPTVSRNAKWKDAIYVAGEVPGASELKPSCDLFSWSIILAHAVGGVRPDTPRHAKELLAQGRLPKKVADFAVRCIVEPAQHRPQGCREMLAVLRKWS